jgi:hypothetical protein
MIVLNKLTTETKTEFTPVDMFHKELDAYCMYKDWKEISDDDILDMALEEIMMDEFLHARFLRDYLMDHEMYIVNPEDEYEKKYWKIHKKLFH